MKSSEKSGIEEERLVELSIELYAAILEEIGCPALHEDTVRKNLREAFRQNPKPWLKRLQKKTQNNAKANADSQSAQNVEPSP